MEARTRILILLTAALLDLLLGDPVNLWHPVQGIGWLITRLERFLCTVFHLELGAKSPKKPGSDSLGSSHATEAAAGSAFSPEDSRHPGRERFAGALLAILVPVISLLIYLGLHRLFALMHPGIAAAFEILVCWQMLAMRSLRDAALAVYRPLKDGDIARARAAVSRIVGRDTARLDKSGITRAAVETVAENTTDGIAAPLFFMLIGGGAGAVFYKAVNTMDSMIGYRNQRYRWFGTAAARMDDVLNYLPARIAALLMLFSVLITQKSPAAFGRAFHIWKRDRYRHPSPNSAQTEAVCAGALGVQLAGDAWYFGELHQKPTIGDPQRPIVPEDILCSIRLMECSSFLMLLLDVLLLALIMHLHTAGAP